MVLPPLALGAILLGLWQAFVDGFGIRSWILSSPSEIWRQLTSLLSGIITATSHTGLNAIVGLVVGVAVAVLLAGLCTRLRPLGHAMTPLVGALAAVPIVCTAPLFLFMFGLTSSTPRRAVVAIAAFVPVYLNTMRGLSEMSTVHADLMRSLAANRMQVLRIIRFPGALPHFCTGLRIAASLAVISAVVSEYFGGLQNGLGSRITTSVGESDYPAAWASVLGAVVLGLIFYIAALVLERIVLGSRAPSAV